VTPHELSRCKWGEKWQSSNAIKDFFCIFSLQQVSLYYVLTSHPDCIEMTWKQKFSRKLLTCNRALGRNRCMVSLTMVNSIRVSLDNVGASIHLGREYACSSHQMPPYFVNSSVQVSWDWKSNYTISGVSINSVAIQYTATILLTILSSTNDIINYTRKNRQTQKCYARTSQYALYRERHSPLFIAILQV